MNPEQIGFCTMAFGHRRYKVMAMDLARGLAEFIPNSQLIVMTDETSFFNNQPNIIPIHKPPVGILHCYHDRRFALKAALERFSVAIAIDADTKVKHTPDLSITWEPGLTSITENLVQHSERYAPGRLTLFRELARKLKVNLDEVSWVGEALLILKPDQGKELAFLDAWGRIARYLELRGIHAGEGNSIGLAAAVSGLRLNTNPGLRHWLDSFQHLDASHQAKQAPSLSQGLKRRLKFHWRLNKARVQALKDFEFYYK